MLTSAACLCLLAEIPALAAGPGLLDEVVVTATRREADAESIPAAVSVVASDRIADRQLAVDALADAVGGYVQQTTPGQGAAIVRGLKGSAVLHLVDGMRLNNAIFRSAPTQYFALIPSTAVERLEVVRGSPAALYGSDAVSGAVQLVTRRPVFDEARTRVTGDVFAAYATADDMRRIGGTVDAGSDRWFTSISGEYLKTGDRRVGGGNRIAPSAYEARALRAAAGLTTQPGAEWLVDLHYYEQPETPRVDELVAGFGQTEPASSEFFFAPNRRVYANVRHERDDGLAGLDWTVSLAWQQIDDDRRTRDFEADERRLETNRSDLYGLLVTAAETRDAVSWIAGLELYYDEVASSRVSEDVGTGERATLTPRFPDGSDITQASVFGSLSRELAGNITLSGGLRYSVFDVRLPATLASEAATVRTGDFAGDLGAILRFADGWQWASNVGIGFRAPNVFDLGTLGDRPGNRFNIPNTALDSEEVLQLDSGLRYYGERLQFELVAYALRYDDRITSVTTGAVTPSGRDVVQSVNAARTDIAGIESGVVYGLTEFLSLRAVLNFTRGEQRVGDAAEEPADRIPPLGGLLEVRYDGGGAWQGAAWLRYADRQSRLSVSDVRDTRIDPGGTPGWAMLGAQVTWLPGPDWSLSLTLDNALDKRYRVHASGIDAPGRNLALRVRRRF